MNCASTKAVMRRRLFTAAASLAIAAGLWVTSPPASAQKRPIIMASTTSTQNSGLFKHLLPAFTAATGIEVRVVAQGTGQALDTARRGDADIVFVHDKAAEEKFVADGFGLKRRPVMYNDFVLIGPKADPAGVHGNDIVAALKRIATQDAVFISRGDRSGTHSAELRFWKQAGIDQPESASKTAKEAKDGAKTDSKGKAAFDYRACGCGMGAALNIASSTNAYVLADRGTWLSFKNKGDLEVLVEGDKRLFNQYGVIVVNPAKNPNTKQAEAQAFSDWVVSEPGQATIAAYKIDGKQLFFPNAGSDGS